MMETEVRPWEWRKANGGWTADTDPSPRERLFHACDVNSNLACQPSTGIWATSEEPNEGSRLCPVCIDVVSDLPAGRAKRL